MHSNHQPPQQPQQFYGGTSNGNGHYGSQPSLPRYASNSSSLVSPTSANGPTPQTMSPLNPLASRQPPNTGMSGMNGQTGQHMGGNGSMNGRYSTYGYGNGGPGAQGGAHPLSHALYADTRDSLPTLAGTDDDLDEKKRLASFPPSSSSSSGDSRSGRTVGPGRRAIAGNAANSAYKRWSGAFIADSGSDPRHTKPERIGWLDGLRFVAAWIALNGTFFDAALPNTTSYSAIQRTSPAYIFRSFGLGLTFLLLILGRALSAPLWDIPHGRTSPDAKYGVAEAPTISFPRLTRAMLTRTFRFILPVLVVTALLWGLGASNATKDSQPAGMQPAGWPYWYQISSFAGYVTVVFNCFSAFEFQTNAAKVFAGNLWTNAWFFQSSFAVYLVHMMLGNLSSARYWIYGILAFFMWTTNNFFCIALIGLMFSDLAAHGQFTRIKKWPILRILGLQILLLAIALCFQFINPVRDNLNSAFATLNVQYNTDLTFCDMVFATCIMFVFETSTILQIVFGNVAMRLVGKLSAGIYLLAPAIVYTVVPSLGISLRRNGTTGSGVLGVTWVVTFAICVVAAIPFHFLIELPSKLAGEYFADFAEKWGTAPDTGVVQVKGPQKSAPKKISGPGGK